MDWWLPLQVCRTGERFDTHNRMMDAIRMTGAAGRVLGRSGGRWSCICAAFHRLYNGRAKGRQFGSKCNSGDRIGCGIEPVSFDVQTAQIFFTKNGKRVSGKSWEGSGGLKLP